MAQKEISTEDFLNNPKMYKKLDDGQLIDIIKKITKELSAEGADKGQIKKFRAIMREIYTNEEIDEKVRKEARVAHGTWSEESEAKGIIPYRKRPSEGYDAGKVFRENLENIVKQEPPLYPQKKESVEDVQEYVPTIIVDPEMDKYLPENATNEDKNEFAKDWAEATHSPDGKQQKDAGADLAKILSGSAALEQEIGKDAKKKMMEQLKAGDIDGAMKTYNDAYEKKNGKGSSENTALNAYKGKVKKSGYVLERTAEGSIQLWRCKVGVEFIFPDGMEKLQQEIMKRTESGAFFAFLGVGFSAIDSFLTYNEKVRRIDYAKEEITETKNKKVTNLNKEWYEYASVDASFAVGKNGLAAVFKVQADKNQQSLTIIPLEAHPEGGAGSMPSPLIPWIADIRSIKVVHGDLGPNAAQRDYWDVQLTVGKESERWGFMNVGYDLTLKLMAQGVDGSVYVNLDVGSIQLTASGTISSDKFNDLLYGPSAGVKWKITDSGLALDAGATLLFIPGAKPGQVDKEAVVTLGLTIPLKFSDDEEDE
jgi:hypothetical protein